MLLTPLSRFTNPKSNAVTNSSGFTNTSSDPSTREMYPLSFSPQKEKHTEQQRQGKDYEFRGITDMWSRFAYCSCLGN